MKKFSQFSKKKQRIIIKTLNKLRVNNVNISERSVKIPDEERYIYFNLERAVITYNDRVIPYDVFEFMLENNFITFKNICNPLYFNFLFARYKFRKTI